MNTEVGSSVRVQCKDGFKLNNDAYLFRKCESNRHWSGPNGNNAHVECVSKLDLKLFILIVHHMLENTSN